MQVRHNRPRVFTTPSGWKRLPGIKLNPDKIATMAQAFGARYFALCSPTYSGILDTGIMFFYVPLRHRISFGSERVALNPTLNPIFNI